MGVVGPVFALFTVGYILGVWTACLVFRQAQPAYEDGVPAAPATMHVIELGNASHRAERRP